ncbi:MAG: 2-C-methyl-D-erythritol 4-phosphate cytidylyltransferase [Bacteroides sp.]|nr:2-C-methyl-D-erythritol 4-phosphate cytidylyltransferase [Bacteroides sp.]
MKKIALILGGGSGKRAGGPTPKQFQRIARKPLLYWCMKAFKDTDPDTDIWLVLPRDHMDDWMHMITSPSMTNTFAHRFVEGGMTRAESVRAGLTGIAAALREQGVDPAEALIMVHDAARPLLEPEMVRRGLAAVERGAIAVPALHCVNSLRELWGYDDHDLTRAGSKSVDRSRYVEVQTPQIAYFNDLRAAYAVARDLTRFTDDASLMEGAGMKVNLYHGSPENIKVTHPIDFEIAKTVLKARKM